MDDCDPLSKIKKKTPQQTIWYIFWSSQMFQVSLEEQQQHLRCESDTEADFLDRNEESSSLKKPENINKQNMLTHSGTMTNGDKDIYASLQRSSDKKEDKSNNSSQLPNNNNNSSGENSVQVMITYFFTWHAKSLSLKIALSTIILWH